MVLRRYAVPLLAVVPIVLSACSSSSSDAPPEEDFSPLYVQPQASANTKTVFGIWGLQKSESGFVTEGRIKLAPDRVIFANRCSKGSDSVTVGISLSAFVTEESISVKEGGTKSANIAGATCRISLTSGDGKLVIQSGKLNLNGSLLFDTKVSD